MSAATWFRIGAWLGLLGVAAGAFGAHGLEGLFKSAGEAPTTDPKVVAPARRIEVFHTGAQYQMYHAFGLLALGLLLARSPGAGGAAATACGAAFLLGIVLFSGSLYAMALTGQRWLGMITPLGGVAFLVGWLALAAVAWPRVEPGG
jgi:uncharacterized membrane protein YgdD (TMEM256/DUF423 family)